MNETVDSLSEDLEENLDRFVVEALQFGCVWGLQGAEGWALCGSEHHDDMDVMPLWSQEAFAVIHCTDDWSDYRPVAIDINEFLEDWLPGMHEDLLLLGVNWNKELDGDEMEPLDLLEEFELEMGDE